MQNRRPLSHTLRRTGQALAAAAILPFGCAHQPAPPKPPEAPLAAPTVTVPPGLDAAAITAFPAAFATAALGVAPADVPLFFGLRLADLSEAVGLPALLVAHPEAFSELREGLLASFGQDLLDLRNVEALGVDLARPVGGFMPDATGDRLVVFAGVKDPGPILRLVTDAIEADGQTVTAEVIDDTHLLTTSGQEVAALVRDGVLYLVFDTVSEGPRANELARRLRVIAPSDSLAQVASFRDATRGIGAEDAGMHVAPERFLDLDDHAGDLDTAVVMSLVRGLSGYAFGLDARPDGVVLATRPVVTEDSLVARLLGPAGKGPDLALRLGGPQVLAQVGVTLDVPETLREVFRVLDAALPGSDQDGSSQSQAFVAEFERELGTDLMGSLAPAFTGDLALRVSGDPARLFGDDPEDAIELTFAAGVADARPVEALLEAIGKKIAGVGGKWTKTTKTLAFKSDEGKDARTFLARVQDGVLTVSTETKLKVGAGPVAHATPRVREAAMAPGLAAMGLLELVLPMAFFSDFGSSWTPEVPAPRPGESAEVKAKRKELAKLQAEADKLRAELDGAQAAIVRDMAGLLGTTVYRLARAEGRVLVDLGLFPAGGTLAAAIRGVFDGAARMEASRETPARARLTELQETLWQLRMELSNLPTEE